ncbi:MAG: transglutaminase family protein [Verrucomicrobium sp.]|nr:transglutaminase family protein [Verrucomicrobium sp.]
MRLRIRHHTVYRYAEAVSFGPHHLMLRPREGHERVIESSRLLVSPAHTLRWRSDAYGNSVAIADFSTPSEVLQVESEVVVRQLVSNPFDFLLDPHAVSFPFSYDAGERADLEPCLEPLYPDEAEIVRDWLDAAAPAPPVETLAFLDALNQAMRRDFQYQRREEPGVQTPAETIAKRSGSCRDYATLFLEACRQAGLAARFVSGYVYNPNHDHGSTHAWAEVYLPGAGWKGYDPTAGLLACEIHVPVAVARHPAAAAPVAGVFYGPGRCLGMDVTVQVKEVA